MSEANLTRAQLYELVWSKPMTHIAKEFGMSDVAVRKHCVNHDIPTPPVGYWAKLAHGKTVRRPPLPTKQRSADEPVHLVMRTVLPRSAESEAAMLEAEARRGALKELLGVPESLPDRPHKLTRALRTALRGTKVDASGFLVLTGSDLPEVRVGRESVDRVLRMLDVLFSAAESRGYEFGPFERSFCWKVHGEPFQIRIHEVADREVHAPSASELKEQAQHEEWRSRYPEAYRATKVYRSWDPFPSGRLAIELKDTNWRRWDEAQLLKRWRDRKSVRLEDCLPDIFTWIEPASVMAREKRLEIEERRRLEAEEEARLHRAEERRANAKRLKKYLVELTDRHDQLVRLVALISHLERQEGAQNIPLQRLIDEARCYEMVLRGRLGAKHIGEALAKNDLIKDEELVIPALDESLGWHRDYSTDWWSLK